jgi:putative PIN family toxin of toxin-antitoxin system
MKVFFDTNVYVAEALLGGAAEGMLAATSRVRWRIFTSRYVLDEVYRVLTEKLGFAPRLGQLTRQHVRRRADLVATSSTRHEVLRDPKDSSILSAAVAAGADLLVTNDVHLLALNPYHGVRIISMADYHQLLVNEGHIA